MYSGLTDLKALVVPLPEDIEKLKWGGDFDRAKRVIRKRLSKDIPDMLKKRLELELEILDMLPSAYRYSKDEALDILRENIRDFKDEEFDELWEEDAMDWIYVDGEVHFRNNFLSNVMHTRSCFAERATDPKFQNDGDSQKLDQVIRSIKDNGSMTYYFRIRSSLKVDPEKAHIGETIRVHLPIPSEYAQVKSFKILDASESLKIVAPADTPQRTVYFEDKLSDDEEFFVEYEFENHVDYVETDPDKVYDAQPNFYLEEQLPHIRFTPYIKSLTDEVTGEETNPLIKARKIYDFITTHVMYSYMRPYFEITDIVEYAATGLKGDCGVQALMFITMCRCAGVPARWQSGLYCAPWDIGCHDWAQFYVAPYGWLFADCSFGGSAYRAGNEERRNFYFGNLDPFRIPANSEFQQEFIPKKLYLRCDPYDNQVGEAEYEDRGLKQDEFETEHVILESHVV